MMTSGKQQLTLKVTQQGDAAVVKLAGAVSLSEAEALRDRLEKLAGQRHPVIVLDLSEMDFICSLGLGAIISAHLKCRHHRGQIRLVAPTAQVRQLLETTRLTRLFPVHDSLEQALAG